MSITFLALGSNIGNRLENIQQAIKLINDNKIKIICNSSLYETSPYGYSPQSNFLNMVIKCETELPPLELLKTIKDIETKMGREPTLRWGPRLIDIDILLYEDQIIDSENLTIPHIELKKRDFFLIPLLEICGDYLDPLSQKPLTYFLPYVHANILSKIKYHVS